MSPFRFALLAVVLSTSGCMYYWPDPYAPPPPPRHHHRHYPPLDEDPNVEPGPGPENPIPPEDRGNPEPAPPPPREESENIPRHQAPPPTTPSKPPIDRSNIPTATRTNKPGRVKNPFAPDKELDVSGLPSGSLAKDPDTGKVFRVP
jgi:hypothetical protein